MEEDGWQWRKSTTSLVKLILFFGFFFPYLVAKVY